MVTQNLNTWYLRLRFALAYPQYTLLAAGLLVLIAASVQLIILPACETQIEMTERRLSQLERANRQALVEQKQSLDSPENARLSLLDSFPKDASPHTDLGRLIELAHTEGLKLSTGEYQLIPDKNKLLDRYVISLPMQGGYPELRRYIAALHNDFPALAIEDINLRRESIRVEQIDAQLRLVIFIRHSDSR